MWNSEIAFGVLKAALCTWIVLLMAEWSPESWCGAYGAIRAIPIFLYAWRVTFISGLYIIRIISFGIVVRLFLNVTLFTVQYIWLFHELFHHLPHEHVLATDPMPYPYPLSSSHGHWCWLFPSARKIASTNMYGFQTATRICSSILFNDATMMVGMLILKLCKAFFHTTRLTLGREAFASTTSCSSPDYYFRWSSSYFRVLIIHYIIVLAISYHLK